MSFIEKILLIDDDDVNNYINARLLKKLSASSQVQVSTNGEEALKYVQELIEKDEPLPRLIFLDINMPVMDGFEFLKRFETLPLEGDLPVLIMLTTSSNEKDVNQVTARPIVSGYLNKPLTEQKVRSIVAKHFC